MRSTSRPAVQPLLRKTLLDAKILSAERERNLLVRYHATQDKAAMDELVRSHMPIIFRVAGRSARNPGVDINDLVQTATEGLLVAINRWSFEKSDASGAAYAAEVDPAKAASEGRSTLPGLNGQNEAGSDKDGVEFDAGPALPRSSRLATYAMWWMRIMLTNNVIENRGMVVRAKNPKIRKALFNIPAAISKLGISLPLAGSDVGRIAAYLGIGEREIEEALVHAAGDVMLDEPIGDGSVLRGDVTPDQRVEDEDAILSRLAAADRWDAVCEALLNLPPRERFILVTRYLLTSKWKLDRLSGTLKMSRERIRQIAGDSLDRIARQVGAPDVAHKPARRYAAAEAQALVNAVEHASANPATIAAFLRSQRIATGPTRVTQCRPVATMEASLMALATPAPAPKPGLAA